MEDYNRIVSEHEQTTICPYNKAHVVLKFRFANHLVKCRKSYTGEELGTCPFNVSHKMPKPELAYHTQNCTDKLIVLNHLKSHQPVQKRKISDWGDSDEEDEKEDVKNENLTEPEVKRRHSESPEPSTSTGIKHSRENSYESRISPIGFIKNERCESSGEELDSETETIKNENGYGSDGNSRNLVYNPFSHLQKSIGSSSHRHLTPSSHENNPHNFVDDFEYRNVSTSYSNDETLSHRNFDRNGSQRMDIDEVESQSGYLQNNQNETSFNEEVNQEISNNQNRSINDANRISPRDPRKHSSRENLENFASHNQGVAISRPPSRKPPPIIDDWSDDDIAQPMASSSRPSSSISNGSLRNYNNRPQADSPIVRNARNYGSKDRDRRSLSRSSNTSGNSYGSNRNRYDNDRRSVSSNDFDRLSSRSFQGSPNYHISHPRYSDHHPDSPRFRNSPHNRSETPKNRVYGVENFRNYDNCPKTPPVSHNGSVTSLNDENGPRTPTIRYESPQNFRETPKSHQFDRFRNASRESDSSISSRSYENGKQKIFERQERRFDRSSRIREESRKSNERFGSKEPDGYGNERDYRDRSGSRCSENSQRSHGSRSEKWQTPNRNKNYQKFDSNRQNYKNSPKVVDNAKILAMIQASSKPKVSIEAKELSDWSDEDVDANKTQKMSNSDKNHGNLSGNGNWNDCQNESTKDCGAISQNVQDLSTTTHSSSAIATSSEHSAEPSNLSQITHFAATSKSKPPPIIDDWDDEPPAPAVTVNQTQIQKPQTKPIIDDWDDDELNNNVPAPTNPIKTNDNRHSKFKDKSSMNSKFNSPKNSSKIDNKKSSKHSENSKFNKSKDRRSFNGFGSSKIPITPSKTIKKVSYRKTDEEILAEFARKSQNKSSESSDTWHDKMYREMSNSTQK